MLVGHLGLGREPAILLGEDLVVLDLRVLAPRVIATVVLVVRRVGIAPVLMQSCDG
jgi:hypothetical protein